MPLCAKFEKCYDFLAGIPPAFQLYGLFDWPRRYAEAVGMDLADLQSKNTSRRFLLSTGCSCTGAPSMSLSMILGPEAFEEIYAADRDGNRILQYLRQRYIAKRLYKASCPFPA